MIRPVLLALVFISMLHGGEQVKIATYNVENLFDMHFDRTEYVEYIPNTAWQWNQTNYRKKLDNLSRVIFDIDADIIALQEVESDKALRDLQTALTRKGLYYPYRAIAQRKKTTVRVALLSRYPVIYSKELAVTSSRQYRNILETKVQIGSEELYLFVNHWKSKSGPESRRIVSAKALRKRLEQIGHEKQILLLGDFNSHYEEYKTFVKRRKHNDTGGMTGINHVLRTVQNDKPVALDTLHSGKGLYYNLWYDVEKSRRWSHKYRQYNEALDSIIISSGLSDGKGLEYVPKSFNRFAADYLFKKKKIYRWQQSRRYPKHHTGKGYSDHLAVFAEFELK